MITFLQGKLIDILPTQVSIDVQGVGYEVLIPLSSYDKLPHVDQYRQRHRAENRA